MVGFYLYDVGVFYPADFTIMSNGYKPRFGKRVGVDHTLDALGGGLDFRT